MGAWHSEHSVNINSSKQWFSVCRLGICWTVPCCWCGQTVELWGSIPIVQFSSVQFSSVQLLGPPLCDPMNRSMPGLPVHHQLLESTQTHVHWVSDAIQPPHPPSSPSSPALNLYQHQDLFQWVSSLHQVAKVLELQLQHQSFQWILRTDLL